MKAQRNNEIASENRNLLKKIAKIITTIPPELIVRQEANNKSLNAIGRSLELDRISKEVRRQADKQAVFLRNPNLYFANCKNCFDLLGSFIEPENSSPHARRKIAARHIEAEGGCRASREAAEALADGEIHARRCEST